jgi:hypothetical protein
MKMQGLAYITVRPGEKKALEFKVTPDMRSIMLGGDKHGELSLIRKPATNEGVIAQHSGEPYGNAPS